MGKTKNARKGSDEPIPSKRPKKMRRHVTELGSDEHAGPSEPAAYAAAADTEAPAASEGISMFSANAVKLAQTRNVVTAKTRNVISTELAVRTTFAELGLDDWLVTTCTSMGFKLPTPVQVGCIPAILAGCPAGWGLRPAPLSPDNIVTLVVAGRNVLGSASTGSGKTAAFALPILQV
jgi:hypothetical protein